MICINSITNSSMTVDIFDDGADDLDDGELAFAVYNSDSKEKLDAIYVRDADDGDEDDDDESDFDSDDLLGSTLDTESGDAWIIDDDELGDDGYCDLLFVFADDTRVVLDDVDTTDYSYFVQVVVDTDGADMDGE